MDQSTIPRQDAFPLQRGGAQLRLCAGPGEVQHFINMTAERECNLWACACVFLSVSTGVFSESANECLSGESACKQRRRANFGNKRSHLAQLGPKTETISGAGLSAGPPSGNGATLSKTKWEWSKSIISWPERALEYIFTQLRLNGRALTAAAWGEHGDECTQPGGKRTKQHKESHTTQHSWSRCCTESTGLQTRHCLKVVAHTHKHKDMRAHD